MVVMTWTIRIARFPNSSNTAAGIVEPCKVRNELCSRCINLRHITFGWNAGGGDDRKGSHKKLRHNRVIREDTESLAKELVGSRQKLAETGQQSKDGG